MAYGKTAACLIAAGAMWGADVQFAARHEHLRKGCPGTITVSDDGISFTGAKKHRWSWRYHDIQQLEASPHRLSLLTYRDSKLRLGADRRYDFTAEVPAEVFSRWSANLDQRFVQARARSTEDGWSLPVKHLKRVQGSEGVLTFAPDRITYSTDSEDDSRTWRYQDIANISSSGPFQLTITTFERARSHYGDRKGFNFQLKQPLQETQYNQLWLEIETKNGRIQR